MDIIDKEKRTMSCEQFYAGALLKFGWLDNCDMAILLDDIFNHSDITYTGTGKRSLEIFKYMGSEINEGITALIPKYTLDTKVGSKAFGVITLRRKLELMMNDTTEEYYNSIDLFWFVLKKIKYLLMSIGKCSLEDFNPLEQDVIFKLLNQGLLTKETSEGEEFDINITNFGKLYLFKKENKNVLEQFKMTIMSLGYKEDDLDRYLLAQNLDRNANVILDIEKFKLFYQSLTPNISRS